MKITWDVSLRDLSQDRGNHCRVVSLWRFAEIVNGYGCIFGCLGSSAVTAQEVGGATSNPHHGGRGGHAHSLAVAAVTTSCDSNNVFAIWFIGMIVVAP